MEITSMSNRELYKTLTGYDYPHGAKSVDSTKSTEFVELNEPLNRGNSTEYFKSLAADTDIPSSVKLRNDNNGILRSRDSFEWSDGKNNKTSADRPKYSNDIDFNDKYTDMVIGTRSLMAICNGGSVPTKESIAKYYGDMAKRLDTAYAEGKFTKEEYDYLNEGIAERMEHAADCAEETAALFKVSHDRSMSFKEYERTMSMTSEELKADFKSAINEYINKYCKIDRAALMKLFNSIRYGK
ncbi:MAG: hypothetical protein K2J72_07105 [Oscillospiraceae bacterium]|nr:hypothetical protein [Oscillospiraceae bacterium]